MAIKNFISERECFRIFGTQVHGTNGGVAEDGREAMKVKRIWFL